jgi:predicted nuclease with TOPRIM domain
MKDFSNLNPNDFTQKDLMLHLLQVSQHTVTREELKEDIADLKNDISKVEARFDKVEDKISKVDAKFDKIQWLIIVTMFTVLFKDYLISLLSSLPK